VFLFKHFTSISCCIDFLQDHIAHYTYILLFNNYSCRCISF